MRAQDTGGLSSSSLSFKPSGLELVTLLLWASVSLSLCLSFLLITASLHLCVDLIGCNTVSKGPRTISGTLQGLRALESVTSQWV